MDAETAKSSFSSQSLSPGAKTNGDAGGAEAVAAGNVFFKEALGLVQYASGVLPSRGPLKIIVQEGERLLGLFGVKALTLSRDSGFLEYRPHLHLDCPPDSDVEGVFLPVDKCIAGLAVEEERTIQCRNVRQSPRWVETDWSRKESPESFITSPIFVDCSLWGVLCGFTKEPHEFSEREILAFEFLAGFCGAIIAKDLTGRRMERTIFNTRMLLHDARSVIQSISLSVDLVQQKFEKELPQEAFGYLESIKRASSTASSILVEWRSRDEAERPGDAESNLLDTLRSQLAIFRIMAEPRGIELQIEGLREEAFSGAQIPGVRVKSLELERVIQCLLENGLKYCRKFIRVELLLDEKRNQVGFRVEDDGRGIPPTDRERVFSPFSRLPKNQPGGGLGLAGARHIVTRNGGRMGVEASPEGGASFWVLFRSV